MMCWQMRYGFGWQHADLYDSCVNLKKNKQQTHLLIAISWMMDLEVLSTEV